MTADATHDFIRDLIRAVPASARISDEFAGADVTISSVRGKQAVDALAADLSVFDDENWDWRDWLRHALGSGDAVIAVSDVATGEAVGFASVMTQVHFMGSPFSGCIDLEIELVSVYLRPDYRGRGIGATLGRTISAYACSIIDTVASIGGDTVSEHGLAALSLTLSSHPKSPEGATFAARVRDSTLSHLQDLSDTAWFGMATLIDETAPDEQPARPARGGR
jgi:GNAT superfamily N-acetyltransferase